MSWLSTAASPSALGCFAHTWFLCALPPNKGNAYLSREKGKTNSLRAQPRLCAGREEKSRCLDEYRKYVQIREEGAENGVFDFVFLCDRAVVPCHFWRFEIRLVY